MVAARPMPSTFYDFHLRFESAASDRWEVVAQCEPRGTTDRAPLRWPVLPAPLETAWAGSVGVHRDLESAGGSRDVSLREVGEALSEAALTGDVGSSLRVALEDARRRGLG
jgi:hypothetical protein